MKWPSSESTGLRSWLFSALLCFLLLSPVGTLWCQSSEAVQESSSSSKDFLEAVKSLSDSLDPVQKSNLKVVLEYYKQVLAQDKLTMQKDSETIATDKLNWTAQSEQLTKLSKSWETVKADEFSTNVKVAGVSALVAALVVEGLNLYFKH